MKKVQRALRSRTKRQTAATRRSEEECIAFIRACIQPRISAGMLAMRLNDDDIMEELNCSKTHSKLMKRKLSQAKLLICVKRSRELGDHALWLVNEEYLINVCKTTSFLRVTQKLLELSEEDWAQLKEQHPDLERPL